VSHAGNGHTVFHDTQLVCTKRPLTDIASNLRRSLCMHCIMTFDERQRQASSIPLVHSGLPMQRAAKFDSERKRLLICRLGSMSGRCPLA